MRDGDPLPASVTIARGDETTIDVAHIYSQYSIGTRLAINLRQGTPELSFVTLVEQGGKTSVKIDTTDVAEAEYVLTL